MATRESIYVMSEPSVPLVHIIERAEAPVAVDRRTLRDEMNRAKREIPELPLRDLKGSPTFNPVLAQATVSTHLLNVVNNWRLITPPYDAPYADPGGSAMPQSGSLALSCVPGAGFLEQAWFSINLKSAHPTLINISPCGFYSFVGDSKGVTARNARIHAGLALSVFADGQDTGARRDGPIVNAMSPITGMATEAGDITYLVSYGILNSKFPFVPYVLTMQANKMYQIRLSAYLDVSGLNDNDGPPNVGVEFNCEVPYWFLSAVPV